MKISFTKRISEKMTIAMDLHAASSKVNSVICNIVTNYTVFPTDIDEMRQTAAEIKEERAKKFRN